MRETQRGFYSIIGFSLLLRGGYTHPVRLQTLQAAGDIRNVLIERAPGSDDVPPVVTTSSGHQLVLHIEFQLFEPDLLELLLLGWVGLLRKGFQLLRIVTVLLLQVVDFPPIRGAICFEVHAKIPPSSFGTFQASTATIWPSMGFRAKSF